MENKKKIIIITLTILVIIIALISSILFITNHNKENNKEELFDENSEEIVKQEESIDGKELLNKLLEDNDYKEIDINDQKLIKKYNSLKGPLIYYYNIESLDSVVSTLIFNAISYDIKNDDIEETSSDDTYTYGNIKKSLLDNKIKDLFGPAKIKITNDRSSDFISVNYGQLINVDLKYRIATLIDNNGNDYSFRFLGSEGTWAWPSVKPEPIKLVESREYADYILVVSKAIYSCPKDGETDKWTELVCSDSKCKNVIDEIKVNQEQYYTLNIDDYINNASTIYTIFKKDNNDFYYYKNIIDN